MPRSIWHNNAPKRPLLQLSWNHSAPHHWRFRDVLSTYWGQHQEMPLIRTGDCLSRTWKENLWAETRSYRWHVCSFQHAGSSWEEESRPDHEATCHQPQWWLRKTSISLEPMRDGKKNQLLGSISALLLKPTLLLFLSFQVLAIIIFKSKNESERKKIRKKKIQ